MPRYKENLVAVNDDRLPSLPCPHELRLRVVRIAVHTDRPLVHVMRAGMDAYLRAKERKLGLGPIDEDPEYADK